MKLLLVGQDILTTNPENFGNQFDDIIGNNFSKSDEKEMTAKATGEHLFSKVEEVLGSYKDSIRRSANERMYLFPEHMMDEDEDGRHVSYTSPKGWKHTWYGGAYIEHNHPKHGPVEVTNVTRRNGEIPTMFPEDFLKHCHEAENDFEADYDPRNWR
jgi:hypothetical protein